MYRPLTRNETAARVQTLRDVLALLWDVTHATGGDPFLTIGRAKTELIQLEADLRAMDKQAERGEPLPPPVAQAVAAGAVEWTSEDFDREALADAAYDAAQDAYRGGTR